MQLSSHYILQYIQQFSLNEKEKKTLNTDME